jgi:hypothetical protein
MPKSISVLLMCSAIVWAAPAARAQDGDASAQDQTSRPKAIEYSEGYETRAKLHKYASFATLPLVGTEAVLGQSLYNDGNDTKKAAHIAVGTAITGLFALNTVTGVWNLWEGRKDPNHRTLRLIHGVLMLGADAGFAAAYATGPGGRSIFRFNDDDRQTHRTIALTALGVAAGGYLMMLIGDR